MKCLKVSLVLGCYLASILGLSWEASAAEVQASRGEARAALIEKGPAIDGTLKDPLWEKCPSWPVGKCNSPEPGRPATWAKVLFDPTHVYVAIFCEEPQTEGLSMRCESRDSPVYMDDSVEVFILPDPTEPYCQFIVNPRGTLYDARGKDPSWNSSAEVRATIDKGRAWTVTMRIPFRDVGAWVGDDETWAMNICRTRPARGDQPTLLYSWSILSAEDFHAPSEFGIVTGIRIPSRSDGATRARPAGARGILPRNPGVEAEGVTIYSKISFDRDAGGWRATEGARAAVVPEGAEGGALRIDCEKGWAGCELPVSIVGSRGLKVALLMRGEGLDSAGINAYDLVSGDNTTAYGYGYLKSGRWAPIVYRLDQFRYNSQSTGQVSPNTHYASIRFYAPEEIGPETWFAIDSFAIYRGDDRAPPGRVTGLEARLATRSPGGRGVELRWNPAADNVGVQRYVISRADGEGPFEKIAETWAPSYFDVGPGAGRKRYRVLAVDFEENLGPWSDTIGIDSDAPRASVPAATRVEEDRLAYAAHVREVHSRGAGKVRKNLAVLFGDSLTGATVYPQCVRAALGNLEVRAFGYPSMTTSFARAKVGEILEEENPEFLLVLYGTNNDKSEERLPEAMADLQAVVEAGERRGTVVALGTIPPRGWSEESAPEARYNRELIALCRRLKIPTAYIFEGFQAAGDRRRYMGEDGVHWTGDGMAIAGRAWGEAFEEIRFAIRDRP